MSILTLLVVVILVGVALWAANEFIPMDSKIKKILNVLAVLLLLVWILSVVGLFDYLGAIRAPHAHH